MERRERIESKVSFLWGFDVRFDVAGGWARLGLDDSAASKVVCVWPIRGEYGSRLAAAISNPTCT